MNTPATRFLHFRSPEIGEWVRTQLGIDPNQCGGFDLSVGPDGAVTAKVKVFLTADQLAALQLDPDIAKASGIIVEPLTR